MMIYYLIGILLFGLILLWWIGKHARRGPRLTDKDRSAITNRWQEIEKLMNQDRAKEAIFEADKLLDFVFQASRLRGETFADRLKSGEKLFRNYQDVWTAHKLRNKLAHEFDFQHSPREAKSAIDTYDQTIRRLIAL